MVLVLKKEELEGRGAEEARTRDRLGWMTQGFPEFKQDAVYRTTAQKKANNLNVKK